MSILTPKVVAFVASQEGVCLEAYKDSKGVWTWGMGVTNASGHEVYPKYKDNPSTMNEVLQVGTWLLETHYLPSVLQAFKGKSLSENQLAAALSFHWNTGAILRADWVSGFNSNSPQTRGLLERNYNKGGLQGRRNGEAELFFDDEWPSLLVPVRAVLKPSYSPDWKHVTLMNPLPDLELILKGG